MLLLLQALFALKKKLYTKQIDFPSYNPERLLLRNTIFESSNHFDSHFFRACSESESYLLFFFLYVSLVKYISVYDFQFLQVRFVLLENHIIFSK